MDKNLKLYQYAKTCIGKNKAPLLKTLGCVEALSAVFREALGEELGENASTYRLYLLLEKDVRFEELSYPVLGCLVISPTGFGNGSIRGHIGIVSDSEKIMSNNSDLLLFDEHYTLKTWRERYVELGGMPMSFFKLKNEEQIETEVIKKKIDLLTKLVLLWQEVLRLLKLKQ